MSRRFFAWLGWLLAVLILYFFENNTGTRAVLLISLLVPLLSMGCVRMAAKGMSVSLQVPEKAVTGGRIPCTLKLQGSGWMTGCSTLCRITGSNGMTGETFGEEMSFSRTGTGVFEAMSSWCGCIRLRADEAEIRDWFGLIRIRKEIRAEASVLVKPALYPMAIRAEPDSGTGCREAGGSHRQSEDPEPGDLRAYLPGDDIRRIHWKLSEKAHQTLVRETAPEELNLPALLLETVFPDRMDPEAMHAAAQGLLSVSRALAAEGITHAVITADNGEVVLTEVRGEADYRKTEEQVLTAECAVGGASIGTLFRQAADIRFRRILLFSPHPGADVLSPAEYQPVTLVLPAIVPFSGSEAGIQVIALDPADPAIDI